MDVTDSTARRAQASYTLLLRALADVSQRRVAESIGISETALSNYKAEHLERACLILAACGLRIVPVTEHTYDEADITALRQLATKGLAHFAPRRGGE